MSCYVVSNDNINKIVTYLGQEHMQYDRKPLEKLEYLLPLPNDSQKLAQAMLSLNVRSFNARYPNENCTIGKITFKPIVCTDHYQMLMTLRNFLYQSCEGKCDEQLLYLALDCIAGNIAYNIVRELPEYQNCSWG